MLEVSRVFRKSCCLACILGACLVIPSVSRFEAGGGEVAQNSTRKTNSAAKPSSKPASKQSSKTKSDPKEKPVEPLTLIQEGEAIAFADFLTETTAISIGAGGPQSKYPVQVWDLKSGKETRKFVLEHFEPPYRVSPDKRTLVGLGSKSPLVLDIGTGRATERFDPPEFRSFVSFSPDSRALLIGDSNLLKVFEVSSGKVVASYTGHQGGIRQAAFLSDGRRALSLGRDFHLWSAETGKRVDGVELQARGPNWFVPHPKDATKVIVRDADGLAMWHLPSGRRLLEFERTDSLAVQEVAFSSDGQRFLLGAPQRLAVWNPETGNLVVQSRLDEKFARTYAMDSTGHRLIAGGRAGKLQIVPLDERGLKLLASPDSGPMTEEMPITADSLKRLKSEQLALQQQSKWIEAAALAERALKMAVAVDGEKSASATELRWRAGQCYLSANRDEDAEKWYRQCLALGPSDAITSMARNELAALYVRKSRYDEAEPLLSEQLKVAEKNAAGYPHGVVTALSALSRLEESRKKYDAAERYLKRICDFRAAELGEKHPGMIAIWREMVLFYARTAQPEKELDALKRRLAAEIESGASGPSAGQAAQELAAIQIELKRWDEASRTIDQARRLLRRYVCRILPGMSENEQLAYLSVNYSQPFQEAIAFGLERREDLGVRALSASWVANGKAIGTRALADRSRIARASQDPQVKEIGGKLNAVRAELASLTLKPVASKEEAEKRHQRIDELRKQEQQLSWQLGLAGWSELHEDPWVELDEIRRGLPKDSVLVDIVRHPTTGFRHPFTGAVLLPHVPDRYVAWIVFPDVNRPVEVVEIGRADLIDEGIERLHEILQGAAVGENGAQALGQATDKLTEKLLKPLLPLIGQTKQWLISPDASLWLVPWAILPEAGSKRVVDSHAVAFLSAARDVAAVRRKEAARKGAVIVADPDYDAGIPKGRPGRAAFSPLPGTLQEARAVAPQLEKWLGVKPALHRGKEASEGVVKGVDRPAVLLLSTHGFFLAGKQGNQNPLTACGLAFAGANRLEGQAANLDDGILTGAEIVGMDLRGTGLVVLSACQTGLGKAEQGEGVAGLRQSFQIAGADSVLATLWSIPDKETAELMQYYFTNLAKGETRSEALAQAQRAMVASLKQQGRSTSPLLWGAFTLTGRWD